MPLVVTKARGGATDSCNLDAMWWLFLSSPGKFRKNAKSWIPDAIRLPQPLIS